MSSGTCSGCRRVRRRRDDARLGHGGRAGAGQQARELPVGAELRLRHAHRAADVEHEIDARRDLFPVQADREHFGTRVGGPIDMPEVVTRHIGTIVLELQRAAGARAKPFSDASADRRARHRQPEGGRGSHRGPVNRGPWHCRVLPRLPLNRPNRGLVPRPRAGPGRSTPGRTAVRRGPARAAPRTSACGLDEAPVGERPEGIDQMTAAKRQIEDIRLLHRVMDDVRQQHRQRQQEQHGDAQRAARPRPRAVVTGNTIVGTPVKKQMYPHKARNQRMLLPRRIEAATPPGAARSSAPAHRGRRVRRRDETSPAASPTVTRPRSASCTRRDTTRLSVTANVATTARCRPPKTPSADSALGAADGDALTNATRPRRDQQELRRGTRSAAASPCCRSAATAGSRRAAPDSIMVARQKVAMMARACAGDPPTPPGSQKPTDMPPIPALAAKKSSPAHAEDDEQHDPGGAEDETRHRPRLEQTRQKQAGRAWPTATT